MRLTTTLGLGLLLMAAPALRADDEAAYKDIVGEYSIVSGEEGGKKAPEEHFKGSTVRITRDTIVSTDKEGTEIWVAKYTLEDSGSKPYKLKMKATGGPGKVEGETARGLIGCEGDTVTLVYAPEGGEEPKSLTTKPGSKQNLFVLKRRPKRDQ